MNNFLGNLPISGKLHPPKTGGEGEQRNNDEKDPIGFLRTESTGDLEFMYFKDYVAKDGTVRFKTYEEEFYQERSSDNSYQFYTITIRLPQELNYIALDENGTHYYEVKLNRIYRGLALININSIEEESPCNTAYFNLDQHFTTIPTYTPKYRYKNYYPYYEPMPPTFLNALRISEEEKNTFSKTQIAATINANTKLYEFFSGADKHGCMALAFMGGDKPIAFKFNQTNDDLVNDSILLQVIGTDNSTAYIELDVENAKNLMKGNHHSMPLLMPDNLKHYSDHWKNPIEDGKIKGIRNNYPCVYTAIRFKNSFGLHILLNGEDGFTIGPWEFEDYPDRIT